MLIAKKPEQTFQTDHRPNPNPLIFRTQHITTRPSQIKVGPLQIKN